jgi:hypothetical protein
MKASQLAQTIRAYIENKNTLIIQSEPGVGKTQIASDVTREIGLQLIHIHVPSKGVEDFGLPTFSADKLYHSFSRPDFLPIEGSDYPDEGVILADELSQAAGAEQKVWANIIQAKEVHGHKIKPGWSVIATGNRSTDRAGASKLLSHLAGRGTIVTLDPDLDDWCRYALAHGGRPEVVSFLRFKPGLLVDFDPKREINASPRQWLERVSPMLGKLSKDIEHEVFQGSVGEGPAAEFVGYLDLLRKLPSPDVILTQPDKAEVPTEAAVRYAICGAIAYRATETNMDRVLTYARRLPAEYAVLVMRDALGRNPDLAGTAAAIDWFSTDGAEIML